MVFTKLIFWSFAVVLSRTSCALVSATSVVTAADADSFTAILAVAALALNAAACVHCIAQP